MVWFQVNRKPWVESPRVLFQSCSWFSPWTGHSLSHSMQQLPSAPTFHCHQYLWRGKLIISADETLKQRALFYGPVLRELKGCSSVVLLHQSSSVLQRAVLIGAGPGVIILSWFLVFSLCVPGWDTDRTTNSTELEHFASSVWHLKHYIPDLQTPNIRTKLQIFLVKVLLLLWQHNMSWNVITWEIQFDFLFILLLL